jgi:branched-chain amino acid transport system ATP-binding protein
MIEHDMSLVGQTAEYLYCLDFGNLISAGTPAEVRADPRVIDAYLGEE